MNTIGYNWKWAENVGRDEFIKQMNSAYPTIDNAAAYDKQFPVVKKPKLSAAEKSAIDKQIADLEEQEQQGS